MGEKCVNRGTRIDYGIDAAKPNQTASEPDVGASAAVHQI